MQLSMNNTVPMCRKIQHYVTHEANYFRRKSCISFYASVSILVFEQGDDSRSFAIK